MRTFLHRNAGALPIRRLLLLAPFSPRLDAHHGGSRAIAQLVAALTERHRVAVVYLRGRNEQPMDDTLRARCELVREVPHIHPRGVRRRLRLIRALTATLGGTPIWVTFWGVPAFAECVRETAAAWGPDVVHLEYHLMAQYLPALEDCPAPRVLVQHDPGTGSAPQNWFRGPDIRRLLAPLDRWAWRRYEGAVMRRVHAVVVFTERDRTVLAPLAGDTPIVRIPLGAAIPERPLSAAGLDASTLLFIGSFSHPPNVDAADRLIRGIFPRVRTRRPDARLILVGPGLPPELGCQAGDGVEVTGLVPDITPYLDSATLVVMPLRKGGGMRVKALEALAAGKAIVASARAVEGLDVVNGREYCLVTTDEEFADRIVHLLGQEEERRRLGTAARCWALEHLSWERTVEAYEGLYRTLLDVPCLTA